MQKILLFLIIFFIIPYFPFSQNVGIGTTTPASKLHIKGSANISQLIIDANGTQGNTNPLIKLRNSAGKDLMWIHTDDSTNVFIGQFAGRVNIANPSGGIFNTFLGVGSGYSNNTGYWNTAIGANTLYSNTTGFDNTAQGYTALYSNTTGMHNSAFGSNALYLNTAGIENTAIGHSALGNNTIGRANTATGLNALLSNTTGEYNAATGAGALAYNSTGSYNTANGANALYSNTTGYNNTAVGFEALLNNTTGFNNTAGGYHALYSSNAGGIGNWNTAFGMEALSQNSSGTSNTACGTQALLANTTGYHNTAIGSSSLFFNTTGFGNTALGNVALDLNTTGSGNTCIGDLSNVSVGTLVNATAIGANAIVNASNKIRLGSTTVTVIEGQVAYTFPSDGRFKTSVSETVKGLDFIMKLRPVVYNFQTQKYNDFINNEEKKDRRVLSYVDFTESEKIRHNGFIAQEVEVAAKETGYEFDGVVAPQNEKEAYGLSYSQFVVPLVKAVQEQQKQISDMKKEIDLLKEQNGMLLQLLNRKN